jgi:hypothetical protein
MKAPSAGSSVVAWARGLSMVCVLGGCGRPASMPDPKIAAAAYADAAAKGDADRLYAMLDERSRRELRPDDVRRLVKEQRAELGEQARAITDPSAAVRARATVTYADGEQASLDLDPEGFRIRTADALPAGGESPAQAIDQLRRVLSRRSYAGLMRVLTPSARSAVESDLRALVEGLSRPEGLKVQVAGDVALVQIEGGHSVRLRREAGLWRVEDFD